ncbi:hypothetical protein CCACVL1_09215 [Corchorus capsularis]|uniref:Uncharacterized protein n=1 Tax=Corchorus capsularis TaxID=210143 RepID=A0A1R3IX91_COCAP|nr:hypothetical protein CCACVL1_09215 [Corchorus capsularis]
MAMMKNSLLEKEIKQVMYLNLQQQLVRLMSRRLLKASPILKPKKRVIKKANTATIEEPSHAAESDVASEHTELPLPVPKKR